MAATTFVLELEHKVLFILFILSYVGAMFIQVNDPKVEVKFADWILGFLTSFVGGTIVYFMVINWTNVGLRMGFAILASLVSYRTFKFINSAEAQEDFARGFWKGILAAIQRLLNTNPNTNNNNDNPDNRDDFRDRNG